MGERVPGQREVPSARRREEAGDLAEVRRRLLCLAREGWRVEQVVVGEPCRIVAWRHLT